MKVVTTSFDKHLCPQFVTETETTSCELNSANKIGNRQVSFCSFQNSKGTRMTMNKNKPVK